jgi:hypothetical protein
LNTVKSSYIQSNAAEYSFEYYSSWIKAFSYITYYLTSSNCTTSSANSRIVQSNTWSFILYILLVLLDLFIDKLSLDFKLEPLLLFLGLYNLLKTAEELEEDSIYYYLELK